VKFAPRSFADVYVAAFDCFQGTASECKAGVDVGLAPCDASTCCVRSIVTAGFTNLRAGSRAVGGQQRVFRYGKGIYSSSTSGKADKFTLGSECEYAGMLYRRIFCVHVAAGRAYNTTTGDLHVTTEPPDGGNGIRFDSVVGEVGDHLNCDEVIGYDDRAFIPAFFLVNSLQ
jgi:hypothetical protein